MKGVAKGTKIRLYNFTVGLDTTDAILAHVVNMYCRFCSTPSPTYMNIRQWPDFVDKSKPSGGDRGKRV
jgi:hypothetical protein